MDGHSWDSPEKKKWLKDKHRTLGNCPPTGIKTKKKPVNKIYWVVSKVALGIYYIAFLLVSYIVGMEAHAEHHAWIVVDALNGLVGGFFLVYPFNIFRMDSVDTLENWFQYTFLMIFLTATAAVIGGILGLGGFI
jgi:hypothetical protein